MKLTASAAYVKKHQHKQAPGEPPHLGNDANSPRLLAGVRKLKQGFMLIRVKRLPFRTERLDAVQSESL